MLYQWSYILIAIGVLNIILGLLVGMRNPRRQMNVAFTLLSIALGFWVIGIAGFGLSQSDETSLIFAKVFYTAPLYVALFFVYLAYLFPDKQKLPLAVLLIPAIPVTIFAALLLFSPAFIIESVEQLSWGRQVSVHTAQYAMYTALIILMFMSAFGMMYDKLKRLKGLEYQQTKWFLIMGLVVLAIGAWYNIILPHWLVNYEYIWVGPLATILYIASNMFSIAKHRMFDIRAAAVRSLAYVLSLAALAGIYCLVAYLISTYLLSNELQSTVMISPINVLLALLLAFMFQPIKQFFDRITDKLFFRDRYNTDEFIARLGSILTSTTHLRTLLEHTADEMKKVFKASHVMFTVYRGERSDAVIGSGHLPRFTADELASIQSLVDRLEDTILIVEESIDRVRLGQNQTKIIRMLQRRHVALVVPLSGRVGYLMIGDALSSGYTKRDIKTLDTISDELVIAIQNARSVQEVRELNTHLQQRIDHATQELRSTNEKLRRLDETKDEFISMASHQLRTPLTSIKGYLSMVLEGDMGAVSSQQQKVLGEAFTSSERMVRLISDFLNVSRLQTGKFVIDAHPTDLAKLIDEEVDAIARLAESHNMTLLYKRPKKFPILAVDEDKLRQVIMNFIDNAIYYSRPKATIVVKAHIEHGDVVVEVHDNGIGVPLDQQEKLFSKFFRADNARQQRPDGTGVGLFLARKVVTAHGGEIIFHSREGKGSVFGFRLPVKKLTAN